jgi:hypothetical protein
MFNEDGTVYESAQLSATVDQGETLGEKLGKLFLARFRQKLEK